jgi:S-adenosylmethionine:tRNA ribosyltransferase-isomerase
MKLQEFDYNLPKELIAHYPAQKRSDSRLLCLGEGVEHKHFSGLPDLLNSGDLLVFNDSKVIPARLFAQKATGGQIEILIERLLDMNTAVAHIRSSKSPKADSELQLYAKDRAALTDKKITVLGREGDLFKLKFPDNALDVLHEYGHMPLPPYIERDDEVVDMERYQTVYAKHHGSVAAPTAGLHFDDELLEALKNKGVEFGYVTLHVGAGTFQPVRCENIEDHQLHSEYIEVPDKLCEKIKKIKTAGGRVIAVGTTSVRCLETAKGKPYVGDTNIFIYPGYDFHTVDALITNFHLPKSSLLMLVSAFAGYDRVMAAYHEAIAEKYRFFSYGDACFMQPTLNFL